MVVLICKICKKSFEARDYRKNKAKYCSYKCYHISTEGKPAWNKGKNWSLVMKNKLSNAHKRSQPCKDWLKKLHKFSKGKHYSPKTEIKKGDSGENSLAWKGGRCKHSGGYIMIYSPNHPYATRNRVLEHRLVIEQQIGRYLTPEEIGHHLGERDDNRPNMLMGFINDSAHHRFHKNPNNVKPEEIIFDGRLLK
jgi:hypothetical protein